jgi:SAM-dependent methyltransferase
MPETTPSNDRSGKPQNIQRERSDWSSFYDNWRGKSGDEVMAGYTEGGRKQEEEFREILAAEGRFQGKHVLEIGFGIGVQARMLRDRFKVASYTGIELTSPPVENIRELEEFPANFEFLVCPAEEVGDRFPSGKFDIAIVHAVAHHFIDPAACFASIAKVCREVVAIEPNRLHPFRRYSERKVNANPNQPVETSYSPREWRGFLSVPDLQCEISVKPYRLLPTNVLNWRILSWVPRWALLGALIVDRRLLVKTPLLRAFSYYLVLRARYDR